MLIAHPAMQYPKRQPTTSTNEEPKLHRSTRKLALSHDELMAVLQYIEGNLAEPTLCDRLAEQAAMTRSVFDRRFKESTGETPYAYVVSRRVARARELLAGTEEPIDEIALRVGFGPHSNFSSVFRNLTGLTPARFRVAKRIASNTRRASGTPLEESGGDAGSVGTND